MLYDVAGTRTNDLRRHAAVVEYLQSAIRVVGVRADCEFARRTSHRHLHAVRQDGRCACIRRIACLELVRYGDSAAIEDCVGILEYKVSPDCQLSAFEAHGTGKDVEVARSLDCLVCRGQRTRSVFV